MGHLARHVGPGFQALRPFELGALPLEIGRHAIEILDQTAQLIGGRRRDTRVEIAARDAAGRARQAVDRVGNALGHPVAQPGAYQDEQDEGRPDPAIEIVALLIQLALPQCQRNGDDPFAVARAHARGGQQIAEGADVFHVHEGGQAIEHDAPIDIRRRASREDVRRKKVALAGRLENGPVEQIHILRDGAFDEHEELVVDVVERPRAPLLGRIVLHQTLGHGGGLDSGLVEAVLELAIEPVARGDSEDQGRNDRHHDEREEQFAVEARAHFAKQGTSRRRARRGQRVEDRRGRQEQDVQHPGQHDELGEIHETPELRDDRIAERINAVTIAQKVHAERLVAPIDRFPERRARAHHVLEHQVRKAPDGRAGHVQRRPAPAIHRELHVVSRRFLGPRELVEFHRLEIGAGRRGERKRPIVGHHPHDYRPQLMATWRADSAAGSQHIRGFRKLVPQRERGILLAADRGVSRRAVLRKVEGKTADEIAVCAVQLDRRGETALLECRFRPQAIGAIARGGVGSGSSLEQHWQPGVRVDLDQCLIQLAPQFLADAFGLRTKRGGHELLLGFHGEGQE